MPATTSIIDGIDFLLKAGGSAIGGGINGSLSIEQDLSSVASKATANWEKNLNSIRRWSFAFNSIWLESSEEISGEDVAITVGGTALKGVKSATLDITTALSDVVNTTTGLDAVRRPNVRTVTLSVDIDYYDPAGTGADAYADALAEIRGSTSAGLAMVVNFGASASFTFTARPTGATVDAPHDGHVQGTLAFTASDEVTDATTGEDTGIGALLSAIFAADKSTAVTGLFGTTTASNTQFTGSAFVASLSISIPFTGRVDVSGTLQGSGALTQNQT